jgi:hypothetical protein
MNDEEEKASQFNISIGGNVSGKQVALGQNIQQTEQASEDSASTGSEADYDLSLQVSGATLSQLRHILTNYFSEEELRSLTLDLAVNYDSLPGSGLAAKARELVAYLARQQRLTELVQIGQEERPRAPWPEGLAGQ